MANTKKTKFTKGLSKLYKQSLYKPSGATRGAKRGANNPRGSSRTLFVRSTITSPVSPPKFRIKKPPKKRMTFGESVARRFKRELVREYKRPAIIEQPPKYERKPWKAFPQNPTAVSAEAGFRFDPETGKRYRTVMVVCTAKLIQVVEPKQRAEVTLATIKALKKRTREKPIPYVQGTLFSIGKAGAVKPDGSYCPWPVFAEAPKARKWTQGKQQEVLTKLFYR